MTNPILLAYLFDTKGGGGALLEADISHFFQGNDFSWLHLDVKNADEVKELFRNEDANLDSLVIDALVAGETRPRMEKVNDSALVILRGVNLNVNADPEDMVSIRLWISGNKIISACRRRLRAVSDIEVKIEEGKGPKNVGDFVYMLTHALFSRIEPVLLKLDDETDAIEEKILENADRNLREDIITVRKQAIMFRRYMAPQRDAISQLRMAGFTWLSETHARHLQESYNQMTRYVEDLDAIRERSQIVKDELANILADKLNKNMYVLSVIAAIFLPLGFLTGLLGINLGGMPGAENPDAFWVFSGLLVAVVSLQIWIFKKLDWF
ncbi:MAG: zinc transporter ZntB [Candidatus Thioglobus sp.]|jgi:zinc transporter|nr:zinc transporter ZntB [Candidatus Pseudothioglobus aerophilus]